jgi:hypothetical protein
MSAIPLVNLYDHIKKDDSEEIRHYPMESYVEVKLPARILGVGPTGSGKTNVILNLIKYISIWDKICLLTKNPDEELYTHLIETCRALEKKHKTKMLLVISSIKDLPAVSDFNPKENSFLLVDDMICEKKADLKKIEEFWIRGRKQGVTMAFLTQGYYETPIMIRKNSNYIIIKKLNSQNDLKRILKEYQLGISVDELQAMYHHCVDTPSDAPQNTRFFMIDLNTPDQHMRFRDKFEPIGPSQ